MELRRNSRKKWKRYKKLELTNFDFEKPYFWEKLKKYEKRKRQIYLRNQKNELKVCKNLLTLPTHIDFEKNYESINTLLDRIDRYTQLSNYQTRIDLSKLNTISINGLVFLISEIDKIKNKKRSPRFNSTNEYKYNSKYGVNKNNEKLKFLLYEIGYWDYFGIKKPYSLNEETKNEYFLSIKSDVLSKSQYVAELRNFIGEKVSFLKNEEIQDYFDDAITEAMANSVEHGYIKNTPFRTKKKWWLCGHYDKVNNYLEFSFRDYGVGLRSTLEYNSDNKVKSIVRSIGNQIKTDSEIIKLLVNDKLPKYKGKKDKIRGYGFKKFKEFAKNIDYDCEMKILSGTGKYKFTYFSNVECENIIDFPFSIDGFLINWKIYLKGKKNEK